MNIVALHGFLGGSFFWESTRQGLASRAPTISLSTPDLYRDKEFQSPSWEEWPSQLETWLKNRGIKTPFVLMGYSMGGRLALNFALRSSRPVSHLVLISTQGGRPDGPALKQRKLWEQEWEKRFSSQPLSEWLKAWNQQDVFSGDTSSIEDLNLSSEQVRASFRGWSLSSQPHSWRDLNRLQAPQLWLMGENDKKYMGLSSQIDTIRSVSGLKPQFEAIKAAGHRIPLEQPNTLVEHIVQFIQSRE